MAKGQNVGFLNFGIDGDDTELKKKLQNAKKDAISIADVLKGIKLDLGNKDVSSNISKAQLAVDKLAISRNRVTQSAMNSITAEERANTAIERTENTRRRGLVLEQQRRSESARTATEVLRSEQINLNMLIRQENERRKALLDEQRLANLRLRNSSAGVQGQRDLAGAYGLTNKTMFSQKNLLQQLSSALGIYFSVYQVGSFVKELATISGEFEKQRVSLAAIIGDSTAATKIFNQIKDLAVISPFNFKELTSYAKQLSAFSIPTNEIYDTTKRLADLSAGLGVDMNRIILAYGQVRSAAVLRGQELRQFTEAGIPLVDELAKKFGELEGRVVSAGEVFDKISNREASFGMVKEIINDLTSEGGKFFEMQELQSATLAGKISNLRDNYDMMLDSIGRANSGMLHGAMDGLVNLLDNWEKYWAVLKGIIVTYGAYKAVIIASSIATKGLSASIKGCAAAQALFNSAAKLNPYALLAAGIGAVVSGLISYTNAQKEAEEELYTTIGLINDQKESTNELIDKLKELTTSSKDNNEAQRDRNNLIEKLSKTEPLLASYIREHANNLEDLTKIQKEYNELMDTQKLAEYFISNSNGLFHDGVTEDLDDLSNAQNKLAVATAGLQLTYTKLVEEFDKINKLGGAETPMGIRKFNEDMLQQINGIIASEESKTEKLKKVYAILTPKKKSGAGRDLMTLEGAVGERIFGRGSESKYQVYQTALHEVSMAATEANKELDALADTIDGSLNNTGLGTENLRKLKSDFEQIAGITYGDFVKKEDSEQLKYLNDDSKKLVDNIQLGESKLRNLVNNIQELGKYGREYILTKWDIALNGNTNMEEALSGWRAELQNVLGTTITITAESNLNDVMDKMQKEYKDLKGRMDAQKPILIKAGFDFNTGDFAFPASQSLTKLGANFMADSKGLANLTEGFKLLGQNIDDIFKPKGGGKSKDVYAEALKKRIELLKNVRSEYEKLTKAGQSGDDAANYLMGLDSYKGIDAREYETEINKIISELQAKKKLTEQQKSLLESLILGKDKDSISKEAERITKESKEAIDKIEQELSKYKDQYSLYESIFGITGDKGQAAKLAFGDASQAVKSFKDRLKEEIEKTTDSDLKKKLEKQFSDLEWSDSSAFSKQMAELLAKYQSIEDKITAIRNKGEEERSKIREQYGDSDYGNSLIEASLRKQTEQINELESESLKLTPLYMQLFGDISNYGNKALSIIIEKTKNLLATLKNTEKNTDGSYTVDIDGKSTTLTESDIARLIKQLGVLEKEASTRNPFKRLSESIKKYKEATNEIEKSNALYNMADAISAVGDIAKSVGSDLANMFDALGDESTADTVGFIGEIAGSLGNIGAGIASGNPVQVIQGIIGGITSIANFHDKKLDKAINRSRLEVKRLQNAYQELERFISRQLGSVSEKQAKELLENQKKQIAEIEKQIKAEKDKKKTDKGAVLDMEAQLSEAKDQLKYFFEDLAKEQYGVDLLNWSSQMSNALVDAFASGEDAAKAFDRTVASIMKDVIKNMINLSVLEPAMNSLREKLFGTNGLLADGTTNLSKEDGASIIQELMSFKDKIGDAKDIWDYLVKAGKEAGLNLEEQAERDSLSKGIKDITEDTAQILASYVNRIDANVASHLNVSLQMLALQQNDSSVFANQLAALIAIQANTLATANNTSKLIELTESMHTLWKNVTTRGSNVAINT